MARVEGQQEFPLHTTGFEPRTFLLWGLYGLGLIGGGGYVGHWLYGYWLFLIG